MENLTVRNKTNKQSKQQETKQINKIKQTNKQASKQTNEQKKLTKKTNIPKMIHYKPTHD